MAFNPTTFIHTYNPATDAALVLKDTLGNRVVGFNVAAITKVALEEKLIVIIVETASGKFDYNLQFETTTDAKNAQIALTTAINAMMANANLLGIGVSVVAAPQTIIAITLANYITLAGTNSLVPLQWYNISDAGNTFGIGTNYYVWAMTNNDTKPSGFVGSTKAEFKIDMLTSLLLEFSDPINKTTVFNNSTIVTSGTCEDIFAVNNSNITATDSYALSASNGSTLIALNSNNIEVEDGANVSCDGLSNVKFRGITASLNNSYAGLFENVTIDKTQTLGKWEWPPQPPLDLISKTSILAYSDPINCKITSALAASKTIDVINAFTDANAKFIFEVTPGLLGPYSITFRDHSLSTILVVDSAYDGATIELGFDKVLGDWILISVTNLQEKVLPLTVALDGQTAFVLSTRSLEPTKSILTVNGLIQRYGYDYTITNNVLTFINVDFALATTDLLKILYK